MSTMDFAFLIFSEVSVESTPKRRVQVTVVVVSVQVVGVKNRPKYPAFFLFAALRWCYQAATELRVFGGLGGVDQHRF